MQCEGCQEKEATVHIQEVVGSEARALHLCSECAVKRGLPVGDADQVGLASLLYKLAAETVGGEPGAEREAHEEAGVEEASCPECGLGEREFRQAGRLGCGKCYETFGALVEASLGNLHRGTRHTGKVPGRACVGPAEGAAQGGYARLQEELVRAVAAEAYERAAELRDEIERLRHRHADAHTK